MFPTSYLRYVVRPGSLIYILQVWWTDGLKENNQPYQPNSGFGKWVDVATEKE